MSTSYVTELLPQIRKILETSDLASVSAKAVRKELMKRGQDETNIKANRSSIDEHIGHIYEELTSTASASSPGPPSNDVPSITTYTIPQSSQPEPLRKKTVKREHDVDEKPQIKKETDAEMAARLQREYDSLGKGRASRSAGRPAKRKKVKRKSAVRVGSDGEEVPVPKRRAGGGSDAFNKELILSDALSELVGEARLSRPQTVKRIWEYVKERGLQDQNDRRYILCDEVLQRVFHSDKVHMFTMNKILAKHFMSPEDVIGKRRADQQGGVAEIVRTSSTLPS